MDKLQRVDIKLSKEELKWAAIEAAKMGISRRQFIADGFRVYSMNIKLIRSKLQSVPNTYSKQE